MFKIIKNISNTLNSLGNIVESIDSITSNYLNSLCEEMKYTSKISPYLAIQTAKIDALIATKKSLVVIDRAKAIIADATSEEIAEYEINQTNKK